MTSCGDIRQSSEAQAAELIDKKAATERSRRDAECCCCCCWRPTQCGRYTDSQPDENEVEFRGWITEGAMLKKLTIKMLF